MSTHRTAGITGGIGCGKSTVTDIFNTLGVNVVDADIVAREVVCVNSAGLTAISSKFGADILLPSGELDRAKLREIIFSHPEHKQWLEALLHPLIRQRIIAQLAIENPSSPYNILSSPLLLETDQQQLSDLVIVIDLDQQTQLKRAMQRDSNSRQQIEKIMDNQLSSVQRCAKADIIIDNNGSLLHLKKQVMQIHQQLCHRFSSKRRHDA